MTYLYSPLVVTKYTMPPVRARLVQRDRLTQRLLAGFEGRLTLIAAPAGFGKSTLAADLARRSGRPTAWLSLDRGDNDPVTWGAYLAESIRSTGHPVLRLPEIPPPQALVATLINELDAAQAPLLLVFDDYHLIEAPEIHEAVSLLLERLPSNLHLIISTRVRPPLPLSRLKARGDLSEVTAVDLRFTAAEAATFLHGTMGLDLPAEGVSTLFTRTEGWVAGLQLGALSLRTSSDWSAAAGSFSGNHPDLLGYLGDEVLSHLPKNLQDFLRRTAILERLSGPLCEAVTGQPDGQEALRSLEQANLFLFPLDTGRHWYRYHPLFADFLRSRLGEQEGEAGVAELHRRAADWYQRQGQTNDAIEHLLGASGFDEAADQMETVFGAASGPASAATLRRWVDRLPKAIFLVRPKLALLAAWTLIATGAVQSDSAFALALEYLEMATRSLARRTDPDIRETQGILAAVRLALAPWAPVRQDATGIKEDAFRAGQLAQAARALLPEQGLFWRSIASNSLGAVFNRASHFAGAAQAFAEAARLGVRSGSLLAALTAMHRQAQLLVALGRLREARAVYRESIRLAESKGGGALPTLDPAYLGLGLLQLEWNDLQAADENLTEARRRYEAGGRERPELCLALARIKLALGEREAARSWLDRAAIILEAGPRVRAAAIAAWPDGVRLLLALGDVASARRWVDNAGVRADRQPDLWRVTEYFALARVLVAEGEPGAALPLLRTLCEVAAATGCRGLEAEGRLLAALALHASGDEDGARGALQAALELTASEGYVRLFLEDGPPLASLLGQIASELRVRNPVEPAVRNHVEHLLELLLADHADDRPLADPLTPRELEILQLVAAGRSNQDVAQALYMGLSTVKWHLINIFGKLHVRNRTAAVARARELGLL